MEYFLRTFWSDEEGQDVAEYSVMLAVILIIVVGLAWAGWAIYRGRN